MDFRPQSAPLFGILTAPDVSCGSQRTVNRFFKKYSQKNRTHGPSQQFQGVVKLLATLREEPGYPMDGLFVILFMTSKFLVILQL